MKNLWGTVLFFDIDRLCGFDRLLTSDSFCGRTIPRRFSKEENRLFSFGTMTTKDRIGDFRLVRLSGLAGWKCISIVRKKEKNLLDNPKEEKTRFGLVGRKVYRKVFSTFDLLVFDRVFENETRNSQNMLWNSHFESVNLKNYPLICDSFERKLRVGESKNFFWLENFGLREFLQNSGLKTKQTK